MSIEPVFTQPEPGVFVPSAHAAGPWDPGAMHGGPPAALLARAIEALPADRPMLLTRMSTEFLGPVPMTALTVQARVTRPGRRLQLAEATLLADGREVCRATATCLRRDAVEVPAPSAADPPPAGPNGLAAATVSLGGSSAPSFASTGMELRFGAGSFEAPGPATVWLRLRRPLVDDEVPSPGQRAAAAGDFGNGISAELDFATHVFINADVTVHLGRAPIGEWLALVARTDHGPEGTAVAHARLYDRSGPLGVSAQSLYVAAR